MKAPPRIPLILVPTPLHRLDRVSELLGVDLWIKRDDLTGFALGGNKGRKLEYLIAAALDSGADTVLTCGSVQSNFIRQLAAACAIAHLKCVAVVMPLPYEDMPPSGLYLDEINGNPLLGRLFGVETIHLKNGTWQELFDQTEEIAKNLEMSGRRVYRIPIGGSSPLGAYAFTKAAEELASQEFTCDWIVTASSSGSTQTGLTYGFRNSNTKVLGISADPEPEMRDDLENLGQRLASLLEIAPISPERFRLNLDYVGAGYGVSDEATLQTIQWLARNEGILLDPIYTGKAFRGLIDLVSKRELTGRILFWHTGGIPTLFGLMEKLPNLA